MSNRTCATCASSLPPLDEYHSAWCVKCELKPKGKKLDKALEQAIQHIACLCAPMAEEDTAIELAHDLIRRCADESPELAEWLQSRSKT